ncbi:hypothetical protein BESB_046660 [Besnoitia besnoiti]|uniref:Uncharacterized protein n=1 Tax=Besnoitia besnoiti TaxID=94643 RepID=A0A2A9MH35_BESBE|nr:hypothetical protein BESB_046660 [Besnoitia besnoiti]PFH36474.1 hypothetical protein BESB_046660 [Besnoitia besnoiti]
MEALAKSESGVASGAAPLVSPSACKTRPLGLVSVPSPTAFLTSPRGPGALAASPSGSAASSCTPKNAMFMPLNVCATSSASTAVPQDDCESTASREGGSPRTPSVFDGPGLIPSGAARSANHEQSLTSSSRDTDSASLRSHASSTSRGLFRKPDSPSERESGGEALGASEREKRAETEPAEKRAAAGARFGVPRPAEEDGAEEEEARSVFSAAHARGSSLCSVSGGVEEGDVAPAADGRRSDSEGAEGVSLPGEAPNSNAVEAKAERSSRKAAVRRVRERVGVSKDDLSEFSTRGKSFHLNNAGDPTPSAAARVEGMSESLKAVAGLIRADALALEALKAEENQRRRKGRQEGGAISAAEQDPGRSTNASVAATRLASAVRFKEEELLRAESNAEISGASSAPAPFLLSGEKDVAESSRTTPSVLGESGLLPSVDLARGLAAVAAEIASAQASLGAAREGHEDQSHFLSLAAAARGGGNNEGREEKFTNAEEKAVEASGGEGAAKDTGAGFSLSAADLLEEGRRLLTSSSDLSVWLECAKNAAASPRRSKAEGLSNEQLLALSSALMSEDASQSAQNALFAGAAPALLEHDESPSHRLLPKAGESALTLPLAPREGVMVSGAASSSGPLAGSGAFPHGEKAATTRAQRGARGQKGERGASRPQALSRSLLSASAPASAAPTPSNYSGAVSHLMPHPSTSSAMTSVMVKSVSPAGVVRRGGRNRRKRTKYDLAYRQMELLGPFAEEAKHVDLSKVSGSSFAVELLKNPHLYSYESWVHGFAWPVGADGRRLLLRKLRGVYWSDPDYWQKRLMAEGLYRRDLFTLATVQELFKVTHLMGADVWDFLLKCTALTHKCDALTTKEADQSDNEEALQNASSPEASSPHAGPEITSQALSHPAVMAAVGHQDSGFCWHSLASQGGSGADAGAGTEEGGKGEGSDTAMGGDGGAAVNGGASASVYPPRLCAALSLHRSSSPAGEHEQRAGAEGEEEVSNPAAASWLGAEALQELLAGSLSRQGRENGAEETFARGEEDGLQGGAGALAPCQVSGEMLRQSLYLPGQLGAGAGAAGERGDRLSGGLNQEKRSRGRPRKTRSTISSVSSLARDDAEVSQKAQGGDAAAFGLAGVAAGLTLAGGDGTSGAGASESGLEGVAGQLAAATHAGASPLGVHSPRVNGTSGSAALSALLAASGASSLKAETEGLSDFFRGASGSEMGGREAGEAGRQEAGLEESLRHGVAGSEELLSSRLLMGEGRELQQALLASTLVAAQGKKRFRGDAAALDVVSDLANLHAKRSRSCALTPHHRRGVPTGDLSLMLEEELDATSSSAANRGREANADSLRALMLQVAEAAAASDLAPSLASSSSSRMGLAAEADCRARVSPNGSEGRPPAASAEGVRRRSSVGAQDEGRRRGSASCSAGDAGWSRAASTGAGAMEEEMRQMEILLQALDHHLAQHQQQEEREKEAKAQGEHASSRGASLPSSDTTSLLHPSLSAAPLESRRGAAGGSPADALGGGRGELAEDGSAFALHAPVGDKDVAGWERLAQVLRGESGPQEEGERKSDSPAVADAEALLQCVRALANSSSAGSLLSGGGLPVAEALLRSQHPRDASRDGPKDAAADGEPCAARSFVSTASAAAAHEGGAGWRRDLFPKLGVSGGVAMPPLRGGAAFLAALKERDLLGQHTNAAVAAAAASSAAMAGSLLWGGDSVGPDRAGRGALGKRGDDARLNALSFLGTLPGLGGGGSSDPARAKEGESGGEGNQASLLLTSSAGKKDASLPSAARVSCCGKTQAQQRQSSSASASGACVAALEALTSDTHALLQLTAHYSFMAQFMQCAMLFEVQQGLFRVINSLKAQERRRAGALEQLQGEARAEEAPGAEYRDSAQGGEDVQMLADQEGPGRDPTIKACLQSLLESGAVHMQFVQLMAQQLRRHVSSRGAGARGSSSFSSRGVEGARARPEDEAPSQPSLVAGLSRERRVDEKEAASDADAGGAAAGEAEQLLGLLKQPFFAGMGGADLIDLNNLLRAVPDLAAETATAGERDAEDAVKTHDAAGFADGAKEGEEDSTELGEGAEEKEATSSERGRCGLSDDVEMTDGTEEKKASEVQDDGAMGSAYAEMKEEEESMGNAETRRGSRDEAPKPSVEEEKELRETTDDEAAKGHDE